MTQIKVQMLKILKLLGFEFCRLELQKTQ